MNANELTTRAARAVRPLLCLAALGVTLGAGCSHSQEHKDGEKFPAAKPPASFIADMERRRAMSAPPGPPAGGTKPPAANPKP